MNNFEKLDEILTSENVKDKFYEAYNFNTNFKSWLLNIIPQVEDCKNQEQRNPWHKYNVLDHILYSVQAVNNLSKNQTNSNKRLLSYAMFFHDLGKPKCHITRIKDGETIDSFYYHNIESARIVKETAELFGFSSIDAKKLEVLVLKHDIFMNLSLEPTNNPYLKQLTPEIIQEELSNLKEYGDGIELLNLLLIMGRADNSAQNEKLTASSFKLLDKFKKMLDSL